MITNDGVEERKRLERERLTLSSSSLVARTVAGTSPRGRACMDQLKALVWFWIIDETLVLTSMLSMCRLNEVGTCQVLEQVMIMVMMVMTTR